MNKALTADQIDIIFSRLEPWLKMGLSVNKSCLQEGIPRSTVYDLIREDEVFAEKITRARNYLSIITSDILTSAMFALAGKVKKRIPLKASEFAFAQWFALNSNMTFEEYGERKNVTTETPEERIRRTKQLIEEAVSKV